MLAISIIVPIYNVEEYLRKCIESALCQTYADFELILVDDGSPDNCGAICDEYAAKDERIRVIHKENGGLSDARNAGLDIAEGKYIFFLDGDDFIDPNLLETVVPFMETGLDMLVFGYRNFFENEEVREIKHKWHGFAQVSGQLEKRNFLLNSLLSYRIGWEAWNRVYRREVIEKYRLRFADNRKIFAEDLYFCLCYCAHAKSIRSIDVCLYNYRIRGTSIMGQQKGKLNIGRYNELGKAVLEHFQKWEDCSLLVENFYTIHYMIVMAHFLGTYQISGLSAPEFKKLAVENIQDWDFYEFQLKKQLKNWRKSRPGFSEADYMEQLCYAYYMLYDFYTIHKIFLKLHFIFRDRFDKENP